MLSDATQTTRRLAVFTPFGEDKLLLTHVEGVESMSSLFEFRLTMLSADGGLDGPDILGRNVTFLIRDHKGTMRWFNGFVNRFSCSGVTADVFSYKASVVPWLWFLTQTSDCRIFQDMSALEIIEKSFNDLGFHDFDTSGLTSTYPKREYCVQYRETDFNFISRLMEEEGIHYFFRHDNGRHEMVLADDNSIFADIVNANDVEMGDPNSSGDLEEQVTHWNHDYSFVAGTFSQTDFDFKEPQKRLMRSVSTSLPLKDAARFDVYEYPGRYDQRKVGQRLARVRMQQQEVQHNVIKGAGNYLTFMPGGLFRLKSHLTQSEVGKQFALIEVMHSAELGDSYGIGNLPENDSFVYRSEFRCVPAAVPFRPQRIAAKPTVEGVQTAIVVGPKGEQIFPDKFGRVKVQFHWDREGGRDENSSCWMRVSQVHAGAGWGMIDLPRIGEEVIVSFLDGDPDRPIIKGRVYNAEARVPFGLPGQMTRSGGKSNTHKGSGYNEVTADDTAGAEQIRMNAQFNMDTTIGNNETLKVGVDRTGNIGNNDSLTVAVDSTTDIGNNQTTTVGVNATYDISNEITITAGTAITLQCGMSTIHMNQAGVITISGQFVSSLAKATNSIVAPMTEIAGSKLLNLGGLVCLDLSGIKHIKGGETTVSAPTINIDGGVVVVKGCPIEIGEVGAPIVRLPVPGSASGGAGAGTGGSPPGGLSEATAKDLAQAVYEPDKLKERMPSAANGMKGDPLKTADGKKWDVLETYNDDDGYKAAVFRDQETGQVVVAYGGTDSWNDWDDNFGQGLGGIPPQYQKADALLAHVQQEYGSNVAVTGHSLGGGLANYAAGLYGVPGVGFNSAPMGSGLQAEIANRANAGSTDVFVHYNNEHDIVHQLPGQQLGTIVTHLNDKGPWPGTSHSISTVDTNDPVVATGPLANDVYQDHWANKLPLPAVGKPSAS